jgi:XTP/dITP diphosphohydrolase
MREIRRILGAVPHLEVLGLEDAGVDYRVEEEDLEPHDTFEENAVSKARYFAARSGLPTVADDSGISVDALGGAPGVRSKRFAPDGGAAAADLDGPPLDQANNRYLVARLTGVPDEDRTARYVCVAALVEHPEAEPTFFRGEAPGRIVDEPAGSGGFGYDPHVYNEELGRTYADMTPEEKDARSHRGTAFRALAAHLSD